MRNAYRIVGYVIAAAVALQAALIAYALFAMGNWVANDGGTLNKATEVFPGSGALDAHGTVALVVLVLVLVFVIVSFFTKIRGATKWAVITLGVVVLQVVLGIVSFFVPGLGALHAINAFALAAVASIAAGRVRRAPATARADSSVATESTRAGSTLV